MSKSKSTRARKGRGSKSTKPRRSRAEKPVTPAVQLAGLLKMYRDRAFAMPSNPLVSGKTPLEALAAVRELVAWLFRQAHDRDTGVFKGQNGDLYVYLSLLGALASIEQQLTPLFEAAREIAGEAP
jgi:hypothetical protein